MSYWVYILASKPGGTVYVGVTNDLVRRVYEHREGLADGFTKRYGVKSPVYFEQHETITTALSARRTSSIGLASGRSILLPGTIPTGGIYTKRLSASADAGLPGQARQ
jgi:predicted GIY-YIG superfamily endonuclease